MLQEWCHHERGTLAASRRFVYPGKILVIDDSPIMHKMYDILLKGYTLLHALSGSEAILNLVQHRDVALILLDLTMPETSGLEILQRIRGNGMLVKIPVIVISSDEKRMDSMECLRAGAVRYLCKPVRPDQLRSLINEIFAPSALRASMVENNLLGSGPATLPSSWRNGASNSRRNDAPSHRTLARTPGATSAPAGSGEWPLFSFSESAMEQLRARLGDRSPDADSDDSLQFIVRRADK